MTAQVVVNALIAGAVTLVVTVFSAWIIARLNIIQHTVDGTNAALQAALVQSKLETLEAIKEALAFERAREPKT